MTQTIDSGGFIKDQLAQCVRLWNHFWFAQRMPYTLGVLRIAFGGLLLYSHLVLAANLGDFVGDQAWINNETSRSLHDGTFGQADFARSYLWHIESPFLLAVHHGVTILVTAAFAAGFLTRLTAPAAWFLQLMYLHRLTGALFGFDQIITYAAMYLMIAPCGSCFSVDALLRRRQSRPASSTSRWLLPDVTPTVSANVATRLLQLHLCVIYLFGGLAKARGETWWDGTAIWYSVANFEYQSVDMTWLAAFPVLFSAMSHATMFWEIFYIALIWPRLTRPLMLAAAVAVHGGIALFLGMITFGLAMIAANMVFIEPDTMRRWLRIDDGATGDDSAESDPRDRERDRDRPGDTTTVPDRSASAPQADDTARRTPAERSRVEAEYAKREAVLETKEKELRAANRRMRQRRDKLKARELRYRERVSRLKEREGRIKALDQRRREINSDHDADERER